MTWQTWSAFLAIEFVSSISVGPAVLFVIAQSLRAGGWRGLWAALGILSANVIWFALSGLGVGAALLAAGPWFFAIKWLGAAYLVYLGLLSIFGHASVASPQGGDSAHQQSSRQVWRRGLILQLTNPKALVFFVALLPLFIEPEAPVWPQILILGATSIAAEFPVLALYAALAASAARLARNERFGRTIDVAVGLLLIAAAVGIVLADSTSARTKNEAVRSRASE